MEMNVSSSPAWSSAVSPTALQTEQLLQLISKALQKRKYHSEAQMKTRRSKHVGFLMIVLLEF